MLNKKRIKLAILNGKEETIKKQLITELISRRYSIADELAIHRQKEEKPEEYHEYYVYAEECKATAKALINEVKGK